MGVPTRTAGGTPPASQSLSLSWIVEATDLVFICPRNSHSDDLVALRAPTLTVSVVMRETSWSAPNGTLVSEQGDALYFDPNTNEWTFERMMGEPPPTTDSDETNASDVVAGMVDEMQSLAQGVFHAMGTGHGTRSSGGDNNQQERPPSLSPYHPVVPSDSSSSSSTHGGIDRSGVSVSSTQDHRRSSSLEVTHPADDASDGNSVDEYYDTFDGSPVPLGNPNSTTLP